MKNNLIPSILSLLDNLILQCEKTQRINPDLFSSEASMIEAHKALKNGILILSAQNLAERILNLEQQNPILHNLFINGKIRLSTAEEILLDENILDTINNFWPEA